MTDPLSTRVIALDLPGHTSLSRETIENFVSGNLNASELESLGRLLGKELITVNDAKVASLGNDHACTISLACGVESAASILPWEAAFIGNNAAGHGPFLNSTLASRPVVRSISSDPRD